jgi:hypothetical protein
MLSGTRPPQKQAVTRFVLGASKVLIWCFPDEEAQKAKRFKSESLAASQWLSRRSDDMRF